MLVKSVYAVCVSGLPSSSRCYVTPCSLQHHGALVHWDLLSAVLFYVYDSAESLAFFIFSFWAQSIHCSKLKTFQVLTKECHTSVRLSVVSELQMEALPALPLSICF